MMYSIFSLFKKVIVRLNYMILKGKLKKCGSGSLIINPIIITPKYIELGSKCYVMHNARIQGVHVYEGVSYDPLIILEDEVTIQQNVHLTFAEMVSVGSGTAIASNVSITDIIHPHEDINVAPEKQELRIQPVRIGKNCKIYNNAVILPGVTLGNHCIVAANTVVKAGIYPDYCVIAGIPGAIIKKYDQEAGKWVSTKN